MGKQKRARQKYHIACVNGRLNENDETKSDSKSVSGRSILSRKSTPGAGQWKVIPEEDLFKDIEIDVSKLKVNTEDDRKSVRSISKSIKRSVAESGTHIRLKKKEKRELRKNLFIKKIDAVHELLHKKGKSKKNLNNEESTTKLEELPEENMLFFKSQFKEPKAPRPVSIKKKPIAKAKKRLEDMLKNVETFKKLVSLGNPIGSIAGEVERNVQNKVI